MVAGIIALALEANPDLTWRDIQSLLIKTAKPGNLQKVNCNENIVKILEHVGLNL